MNDLYKRDKPVLCISCPVCGAVFDTYAILPGLLDDDFKSEIMDRIGEYATQGYRVDVRENDAVKLNYCEHLK